MKRILLQLILSLITFFFLYSGIRLLYQTRGRAINGSWNVASSTIPDTGNVISVPFSFILNSPGNILISQKIIYSKGERLILPRISGNRIVIYLDGEIAGVTGGREGTGNLWTTFHDYPLPDSSAGKIVNLEIEISGIYSLGIRMVPYLIHEENYSLFLFVTDTLLNNLYWLAVGCTLMLALLLTVNSIIHSLNRISYFFLAIALLFSVPFQFEYIFRETSGSIETYLWMRKLFLSSALLSTLFLAGSMEWNRSRKLLFFRYISISSFSGIIFLLFSQSHADLYFKSRLVILFHLPNIAYVIYATFFNRNRSILFGIFFWSFSVILMILDVMYLKTTIHLIAVGYLLAIISISISLLQEYIRLHEDYKRIQRKALLDPLTGAFNRNVLDELVYGPNDHVVLVDLNDFKQVNDKHGHEAGDRVLKEWVRCAQEHIRHEDMVIRYGGDEFLILLRGEAGQMITRIEKAFKEAVGDLGVTFSSGLEPIKSTLEEAIKTADCKMYSKKRDVKKLDRGFFFWFLKK